jgi:hypothetical protein
METWLRLGVRLQDMRGEKLQQPLLASLSLLNAGIISREFGNMTEIWMRGSALPEARLRRAETREIEIQE